MIIRICALTLLVASTVAFAENGEVRDSLTIKRINEYAEPQVGTIIPVVAELRDQLHLEHFDPATGNYSQTVRLMITGRPICKISLSGVSTPDKPHPKLYLTSRYHWKVIEVIPVQELPPNRDGTYKTEKGRVVLQSTGDSRLRLEIESSDSNNECLGKAGFPRPIKTREETIIRQEVSVEGSEATT